MTTIISVDVQEEYKKFFTFKMHDYVEYLIKQVENGNKVILFYNSFGVQEEDEAELITFLYEYLYDHFGSQIECSYNDYDWEHQYEQIENKVDNFFANITNVILAPKTYAYFRTDVTSDKELLSTLIKQMIADDVFSIDEYSDEQIEQLEEYAKEISYTREYFGFNYDVVSVLEKIDDDVILIGGGEEECLFEIEIELMARNIAFEKYHKFIY